MSTQIGMSVYEEVFAAVDRRAWSAALALLCKVIVPDEVTGEPLTVSPVLDAATPTEVTVPEPPPPPQPSQKMMSEIV